MAASNLIRQLPNELIAIITLSRVKSERIQSPLLGSELDAVLNAASEPLFLILDASGVELPVEDLMTGANKAAFGDYPLLVHPKIREILEVGAGPVMKIAAEGLGSPIFGNIKIRLFNTLPEALAYARERL